MKKRIVQLLAALLILPAAMLFSAAAGEQVIETTPTDDVFISFTDSYGRDITLQDKPRTIVSLGPNVTEAVYALGRGNSLIGRTMFCDYPEEALSVESIGTLTEPNIERIIELNPDLVIGSTHVPAEVLEALSNAGIPTVGIYSDETFDGVYSTIRKIGAVLGETSAAEKIIFDMDLTISDVTKRIAGLPQPSVYYVVGFGEWGDFTAGGNTFINNMISIAGGRNIAEDITGWSYSLEKIIENDPDYIIISKFWGTKESFEQTPNYMDLRAVEEGRLIAFDNNMFDRQGVRNADGVRALAEILHPEAFK